MTPLPNHQFKQAAAANQAALIDFTQRIVRIPSMPGHEGDVAAVIQAEMETLGYDEVWRDEAGNIIGKVNGGDGPTVLLNGHMDHVDPGPAEGWPYPPFSGQIVDGELWGRASVDMKGPVAAMIYGTALFKQLDLTPPGDILMTVAVMEEIGGLGSQYLASTLQADAAICGEPSRNILRRGHRGRVELTLTFKGKSIHASVPHLGINPHYDVAHFLTQLPTLTMVSEEPLGQSSVTPTLYQTDQTSRNVSPGEVRLTLDWRNVAAETPEQIVAKVQQLADDCLRATDSQGQVSVQVTTDDLTTYSGLKKSFPALFPSFLLPETHAVVQTAHETVVELLSRDDGVTVWQFATDGGHLMAAGIPTIGFGPGDELLPHTNQERINLTQMEEAVAAYAALTLALARCAA